MARPDPGTDAVVHTGKPKGIFVDGLQIAFGEMELLCHQGDAPGKLWTVVDGFAQGEKLLKARMGLLLRDVFSDCLMQLKKQKRQELVNDSFVVSAGKGVFPGEELKEIVAVFRVRQGEKEFRTGEKR